MNYANSIGVLEGPDLTVANNTGSTIKQYTRVSLTTGAVVSNVPAITTSGIADVGIGYVKNDIPTGQQGLVRLSNAQGTQIGLVAATITIAQNDPVWTAANGTLSNVQNASGILIGHWLSTGAAATPVYFVITPFATS